MTTRPRATRLLVVAAALSLALSACGGTDDTGGLPTADDLGGDSATGQPDEQADQPIDEQEPPTTSGMCSAEEPDCQDTVDTVDTVEPGDGKPEGGDPAAGSCLAGDEDCTDESYGGQDMARPIPLAGSPSDAERIERGATSGATGRHVTAAYLAGDTTLELTFEGGACDLLEDVVVEESTGEGGEVRVLVLSGMDASVDMCTQQIMPWSTEVELDTPLGDRQLFDLSG